jgi:hypothetical protein
MHGATTSTIQGVIVNLISFQFGATIGFDTHVPKVAWIMIYYMLWRA